MNKDLEDKYKTLYQAYHKSHRRYGQGTSLVRMSGKIKEVALSLNAKTGLDFGCGKAKPYKKKFIQNKLGLESVDLYDLAIKRYEVLPNGKFDIVMCSDVMEHVPLENIEPTIDFSKIEFMCFLLYIN